METIKHKDKLYIKTISGYKEILSSTNTSLRLPKPSQQFIEKYIEEYNKGNIITEVLVEVGYADHDLALFKDELTLKLDSQNQITIRKQKDSWSREEIEWLMRKTWRIACSDTNKALFPELEDKFIEENL